MIITAYGFILFVYNELSFCYCVTISSYWPSSLSLLPLSTYLIPIGIYSSAISISQNMMLRKSIRNVSKQSANLLLDISTAQVDIELRKVIASVEDNLKTQEELMEKETGMIHL